MHAKALASTIIGVTLALACASEPGYSQVTVTGDNLARSCYRAALDSVKGALHSQDGLANCTAALNGPMSAKNRAATYDNRGILYDAQQNYSDSWWDFNSSIRVNPKLGDAYVNRGVALIRLHKPEQALMDIQKGMALGGSSLPEIGYYDLAVAEETLGRVTDAYYDFKHSLAINPNFAPADKALKNFTVTVIHASRNNQGRDASTTQ